MSSGLPSRGILRAKVKFDEKSQVSSFYMLYFVIVRLRIFMRVRIFANISKNVEFR